MSEEKPQPSGPSVVIDLSKGVNHGMRCRDARSGWVARPVPPPLAAAARPACFQ